MKLTFQALLPGNAGQEIAIEENVNKARDIKTESTLQERAVLRTPVREKARKINSRNKKSPGKFP